MAFELIEREDSRPSTMATPSQTYLYLATGEDNEGTVRANVLAATASQIFSATLGRLYRQDVRLDPDGWKRYIVTVPYGPRKKVAGQYAWTFDTQGATAHVVAGKEHLGSYFTGGLQTFPSDNPHKGLIGVNDDQVEGTEITIPCMKLSYDFRHELEQVDEAFARLLYRATGKTNTLAFRGFAAGELLFLGATGSDGSETEAQVTYHFAASENVDDLQFGDIANIVKGGWDFAWVEWKRATVAGRGALQPEVVHVERMYNAIDYAATFGWS